MIFIVDTLNSKEAISVIKDSISRSNECVLECLSPTAADESEGSVGSRSFCN